MVPVLAPGIRFKPTLAFLSPEPSFHNERELVFLALQAHPYFLAPVMQSAISPRKLVLFEKKIVFRRQDLSARCAYCYWGVLLRPRLLYGQS